MLKIVAQDTKLAHAEVPEIFLECPQTETTYGQKIRISFNAAKKLK